MNNIQISAPSNPRHQISVTVDPNLGYVVAVQKANGNLGRKKALRERRLTAVQQFLQTKVFFSFFKISCILYHNNNIIILLIIN